MDRVNLNETQESLADIVARVEGGETVVIIRDGEAVARIEPVSRAVALKPIDFARLRNITKSMTPQSETSADFIRRLRDEARF